MNKKKTKIFAPKLFSSFKNYNGKKLVSDIVAGVIVAIIALPLSIALAIASGAEPVQGLYTAIFAGFVISFFGGSRVNISGPTAAFATIVAGIIATEGFDGLIIATILAGIILIIFGLLRVGSLIRFIPTTITVGFTAGIAVTIVIGQLKDFFGMSYGGASPVEAIEKLEALFGNLGSFNPVGFLVGAISLALLFILPKIKFLKKVPASLIVVVLSSLAVAIFKLNALTIGDLYEINAGLPKVRVPEISLDRIISLLPNAFTIAILAAIESLLSCVVSDKMIDDTHNSNTELIAQGLGNIASGIFGGIPATGAIARTSANVKNGGRTPISGMVHAITLLLVLLFMMPLAKFIPMPVIAAVLLMVAYNMCEYKHFIKIVKNEKMTDVIVLLLTFVLTIVFDLVVAIAVGLAVAFVFYLFRKPKTKNTTVG